MILQDKFCMQTPDISYPCKWEYKIILDENIKAKDYLKTILNVDFDIKLSKTTPKYKSYNLVIQVNSQEQRLAFFELLKNKCKYVL